MAAGKLTAKQEAFVLAYIGEARFNASKAAAIAGYKDPGQAGYHLKKKEEVRARIDAYLDGIALTAKEVLVELTDVASAEWRDFITILEYDDDGKPLRVKMDLTNKVKSLELLGKHHQLFSENLNISGGIEVREFVGVPDDAP
jgi:phage terminase small subunit